MKLGHIFIVLINIRGFSLHKHKNVGAQIESKVFIATFVIYARNVMLKDDNKALVYKSLRSPSVCCFSMIPP